MSSTSIISLIARRELRERAAKKGYIIGTIVTVAVVVAAVVLPAVLRGDGPTELRLGVVGGAPADLDSQLAAALGAGYDITVEPVAGRPAATEAVEDGHLDLALVDRRELLTDGIPDAAVRAALDGTLQVDALARNLEAAGLDEMEAAAALTAPPPLEVVDVSGEDVGAVFLIAFLVTFLLVVGVQMNGATLLSGALEEKSNRVVEILVSAARPWQLLTGKILATSLLSFLQIGLIVGAGLAANAAVDAYTLPAATARVLWVGTVMLLAGFLFYAALFTVAGTLASTVEDSQSIAGPLYLVMWGAYGAVFAAVMPNPSGVVSQVLTFLPPTAPFIVPARVAMTDIALWQVAASLVVTVLGAIVTVKIAGRLYAASLLAGGRLSWSAAWKAEPVR